MKFSDIITKSEQLTVTMGLAEIALKVQHSVAWLDNMFVIQSERVAA